MAAMLVATDQCLVMGVCTHNNLLPPAMSPVPLPYVYLAKAGDPAARAASAVVTPMQVASGEEVPDDLPMTVNGIDTANVGTIGSNATTCQHIEQGGPFAPIPGGPIDCVGELADNPPPPDPPGKPAGNAVITKGSDLVMFGKGAVARLGDQAKCCSEPVRMTASVLAIPKGKPVLA